MRKRHNHRAIKLRLPKPAEVIQTLRHFANPAYHFRKLREDLLALWAALRSFSSTTATRDEVVNMFRGKLLACFYLTGPSSWVGLAASYWLQRRYSNPFVGQYSEPVINMVLTTVVFQLIWAAGNPKLYRGSSGEKFRALERDMLPVHWNGIKVGMTFNLVVFPVSSAIIGGILFLNRQAAIDIPAWVVTGVINTLFVQPQFMRAMGNFFEKWAGVLADRHPHLTSPERGE